MSNDLLNMSIIGGRLLWGLFVVVGVVVAVLLARRMSRRRLLATLAAIAGGALLALLLVFLLSDVFDVFGVPISPVARLWMMGFFAILGLAVVNLVRTKIWRKVVAVVSIPLALLAAAGGINADFGQYTTVRSALGLPLYPMLDVALAASTNPLVGTVGTVVIPATVSGFKARPAVIYLPPAARRPNPPVLPVVEMLSGQPGSPDNVFDSGKLADILDAYAAKNAGVAPIVVVPDQLGAPDRNPMCLDSPLGQSATYLTVDVPAWVKANFSVPAGPVGWSIAGYSQGGTCSIQLGAAHPDIYDSVLDISGELEPKLRTPEYSISAAFGGDRAAYEAAAPKAVLQANAPYSSLLVMFAAGSTDTRFLEFEKTLKDAATKAGARTELFVSPGTGHDWKTVMYAWTKALPILMSRSGIPGTP